MFQPPFRRMSGRPIDRRVVMQAGVGLMALGAIGAHTTAAFAQEATPVAQEATPVPVPDVPDDFKVVLHTAQEQDWAYVLSNLDNLTTEWPHATLRVVVDGSAVYTLASVNDLSGRLAALVADGVDVHVCPNALKEHKIDPAEIGSWAKTDLGGVVALVQAMNQGFHYIKP